MFSGSTKGDTLFSSIVPASFCAKFFDVNVSIGTCAKAGSHMLGRQFMNPLLRASDTRCNVRGDLVSLRSNWKFSSMLRASVMIAPPELGGGAEIISKP